jgi:MoxR-like ATPase
MNTDIREIQALVDTEASFVTKLTSQISSVIVGQKYLIERLLMGVLADGHILIEGVPGLAKTLSVKTLADAIQAKFQRIQFTPDLLPADLIGTLIYNPQKGEFSVRKDRSSPISSWPMKLTAPRPKCNRHCLRRCRSDRSRSVTAPTN